jgi:hypothetical protein
MFFGLLRISQKYKVRHQILQNLYEKLDTASRDHKMDLSESTTTMRQLATALKINHQDVRKWHMSLHVPEDEHVECDCESKEFVMSITEAGMIAYLDDYWLREGEKDLNDRIYNVSRWALPLAALLISILALVIALSK